MLLLLFKHRCTSTGDDYDDDDDDDDDGVCFVVSLQLLDEFGKVRGWLDAGQRGTGNWMKFVRSSSEESQRNLMALQVKDQVSA